jgi:hypothetical protein
VARKIVNICIVIVLLTGCWGGVLAAACPHLGCETAAASDNAATPDEHVEEHGHHSASPEDHSLHSGSHGEGHTAESPAQDPPQFDSDQFRRNASNSHDPNCDHCVGSTEAPPSQSFEWQSNSFKNGAKLAAPRAAERVSAPAVVFVREITPAQHAPPGRSDRHLLLSVFRI